MNQGHLLLFAIPVICIIVIAFTHFRDAMFKKRFVIERRTRAANTQHPDHNRRHNDPKTPGAQSEATSEPSAASGTSTLETSGIRQ
jgi:hypothetical protein